MKKISLILLSVLLILSLAACGNKCEHTYDNACDATCNDCGETREVSAHDYAAATCTAPKTCKICGATEGEALGHTWTNATCTAPKTCSVCGATDGNALGHTPADDDGDCTTEVKCTVCGETVTAAKAEHIAHADDGDCTTAVTCTACDTVVLEARSAHDHSGEWLSDADGHWHVCKIDGCTVTDEKTGHTPDRKEATVEAPKKCTECGYIIEPQLPHTHSYTVQNKNETHHWMECTCSAIDESTKTPHSATDDHNCATPDVCSCGYTVRAAADHVAGADDGNCTTDVKCVNCDQIAESGYEDHVDADHDYTCDNTGCQVTVGTPPKDENSGIDLPIDRN